MISGIVRDRDLATHVGRIIELITPIGDLKYMAKKKARKAAKKATKKVAKKAAKKATKKRK